VFRRQARRGASIRGHRDGDPGPRRSPRRDLPHSALRTRVWELRDNLTAADGFFVALAERLDEPLATKDQALAAAARTHAAVDIIDLSAAD